MSDPFLNALIVLLCGWVVSRFVQEAALSTLDGATKASLLGRLGMVRALAPVVLILLVVAAYLYPTVMVWVLILSLIAQQVFSWVRIRSLDLPGRYLKVHVAGAGILAVTLIVYAVLLVLWRQ